MEDSYEEERIHPSISSKESLAQVPPSTLRSAETQGMPPLVLKARGSSLQTHQMFPPQEALRWERQLGGQGLFPSPSPLSCFTLWHLERVLEMGQRQKMRK